VNKPETEETDSLHSIILAHSWGYSLFHSSD